MLVATFNRRDKTLACLESLERAIADEDVALRVFVADASSPDGTRTAIEERFPFAEVLTTTSETYWAEGMRAAWEAAQLRPADFTAWLNDDVVLDARAIDSLMKLALERQAIVVGATREPGSDSVSYSAYDRGSRLGGINFPQVAPTDKPQPVWAINGNVVVAPSSIDLRNQGFPIGYRHALADYAYGLRARRQGIPVLLAPGTVGECSRNQTAGTWQDVTMDPRSRFKQLRSPKGLPIRPWFKFCLTYGGLLGLISATKPYAHLSITSVLSRREQDKVDAPKLENAMLSTRTLGGLNFVATTPSDAAVMLCKLSKVREKRHIHLLNAYSVVMAHKSKAFRASVSGTAINLPDGKPVSWFAFGEYPKLKQIRGPQLFEDTISLGRQNNTRHFLLGASEATLADLKLSLERRYPGVCIAGTESPPFRQLTATEVKEQDERIRATNPDIVWVGLGTPKQDIEAKRLASTLKLPAVAVGAAFDFSAGTKPRAPEWISKLGFEWLHRLSTEPRRLWRRYLIGNIQFMAIVATEALKRIGGRAT